MASRTFVAALLAGAALLSPCSARAEELARLFDGKGGTVRFEADRVVAEPGRDRVRAIGHVRLRRGEAVLRADVVVLDRTAGVAFAEGHVLVRAGVRVLRAKSMRVDLEAMVTALRDAELFVKEGVTPEALRALTDERVLIKAGRNAMRVRARKLVKGKGDDFVLEDAALTPCDCGDDPPSWQLTAPRMEIDPKDGAYLERPVFRVGEQSILGLPAAWVPFGDRRTGFLQPQVAYTGVNGWLGQGSFFWAPTRSFDATASFEYLETRGPRPALELRYAASPQSDGRLSGAWIDDRADHKQRFHVDGFVRQAIGENARAVFDLALVSDAQYVSTFFYSLRDRSTEYLSSTLGLEWQKGDHAAFVAADWYQDLQGGAASIDLFSSEARATVHRLPRARYELLPRALGDSPILFGLRAGVQHFYRTGDTYDDLSGDGAFQATDPARIYRRLDVAASLAAPLQVGALQFTPRATYRQLVYDASLPGFPATRGHALVGADLSLPLARIFGAKDGVALAPVGAYKHVLEPVVAWRYVPATFERGDGMQSVGAGLGLDDLDNLYGAHRLYAGLRTRLVRKVAADRFETPLSLRLTQGFDLAAGALGDLRLRAQGKEGIFESTLDLSYAPSTGHLEESLVSVGLRDARGDALVVAHNYLRSGRHERFDLEDPESPLFRAARSRMTAFAGLHELVVSPTVRLPYVPLTLSWTLQYSFTLGDVVQSVYSMRYESPCKCWGVSANVAQILGIDKPVVGFFLSLTALGSGGAPPPVF